LQVVLDTGSSDFWAPAASSNVCKKKECLQGSFDSAQSSSFHSLHRRYLNEYVSTNASGEYITESVQVGNATFTNFTMVLVSNSTSAMQGIMGISYSFGEASFNDAFNARKIHNLSEAGNYTTPTIVDAVVSNGYINRYAYSLYLDDINENTGSVLFGGIDTTKYTGDLVSLPVQPADLASGPWAWARQAFSIWPAQPTKAWANGPAHLAPSPTVAEAGRHTRIRTRLPRTRDKVTCWD
jgi:Eukaryotic aspartyl protease